MVRNARPTRAEASDVANAILDGTDAVMLSAETAIGEHPVEAVQAMARICLEVEPAVLEGGTSDTQRDRVGAEGRPRTVADAIAYATTAAAGMLDVPVIACFTKSGFTARQIAAYRPTTPIFGLSSELSTCRSLAMVWGVTPILVRGVSTYEELLGEARDTLLARGIVRPGDRMAVTAGVPFHVPGTTNLLKVETV
jgi:pyruvate kinase